jgi:pimeloyl-ACP methyl ester carboxylesterase
MKFKILSALLLITSVPALACEMRLSTFDLKDERGRLLGDATVREYMPKGQARPGSVLVLPPTGGETPLERLWSREMCRVGFRTQILVSWPETEYDFYDPRMHNDFFNRVRLAAKAVLAKSRGPVALIGTSLGGIVGSSLVALEPRIKVAALIATGAHVSEILSESDHPRARRQTRGSMKRHGIKTVAEYEAFLNRHVSIDPADLLSRAKDLPETLHVLTTNDVTVPTRNQLDLINLFPNPSVIKIHANHFLGILSAAKNHRHEIRDFLSERMPTR